MAKATKRLASVKISYRLTEAAASAVELLAERTGWSAAKSASLMLELASRVLWATEHSDPVTLKSLRESRALIRAAGQRRNAELHAASSVKLAKAKEAAARKAVAAGGGK